MSRIIDLTLTLKPGMRGVEFEPQCTFAQHGWNSSTLHLYSHCGTHMDAQVHYEAGTQTVDQIPLERCMGPAWVVNLSGIAPKALIRTVDLGSIAGRVRPGDSLLLRTGWSAFLGEPSYRDDLPRVGEELAQWCVQHKIRLLGVEPPAVADINNPEEIGRVHQILLTAGVIIVEALTNLDALHQEKVFFAALPLKPLDGDGSPVRAFAIEGIPPEGWLT